MRGAGKRGSPALGPLLFLLLASAFARGTHIEQGRDDRRHREEKATAPISEKRDASELVAQHRLSPDQKSKCEGQEQKAKPPSQRVG